MRLASATVSEDPRAACLRRGNPGIIACFSQEGKGLWVCRVHTEVLCLRNCTSPSPATCTRRPRIRPRAPARHSNTFIYPNSSLIRSVPLKKKNLLCSHIRKDKPGDVASLENYILVCVFLSRKKGSSFPLGRDDQHVERTSA